MRKTKKNKRKNRKRTRKKEVGDLIDGIRMREENPLWQAKQYVYGMVMEINLAL